MVAFRGAREAEGRSDFPEPSQEEAAREFAGQLLDPGAKMPGQLSPAFVPAEAVERLLHLGDKSREPRAAWQKRNGVEHRRDGLVLLACLARAIALKNFEVVHQQI